MNQPTDRAVDATVEDTEVVSERMVSISCRWCGRDDTVAVARPGADFGGR